jgi:hypothetical protein
MPQLAPRLEPEQAPATSTTRTRAAEVFHSNKKNGSTLDVEPLFF